jgi:hypothetical protein
MSGITLALNLAMVAVFAGAFAHASYIDRHRQRERSRSEPEDPAKWTGQAIDATKLKPRLEDVRLDHKRRPQAPSVVSSHRASIDFARRDVARLSYFHDRESESQEDAHGPCPAHEPPSPTG